MGPERRLAAIVRAVAGGMLFCLAFSGSLWISTRLYPLTPALGLVPPFPWPLDALAAAVLVGLLCVVLIRPLAWPPVAAVVIVLVALFAQDQSRLWPSFYTFFLLFVLAAGHDRHGGPTAAERTLTGMRLAVAAIYFWGGVHKLTPHFFAEEFPWFVEPFTGVLPIPAAWIPWLGVAAAVVEVAFAIGLLTRRFRRLALWVALAMHVVVLVCIGPIRGHWNDSAWAWSLSMAAVVGALFHAAAPFDAALVLSGPVKRLAPQAAVAVLVGIMPLLNGVSRWDSALSFNVYSGNQSSAVVVLQPDAVQSLPPAVAAHVTRGDTSAVLDLDAWSMAAFNAGVYPERRVFRRLFTRLCDWVGPDAACLVVVEKATWFTPKATTIHAGNAGP
ncbi:hypothetical protein EBR04_04270 [bacterium]|nr:hypothetical protein [bacterium]